MEECYKCGISEDKAVLFEVITGDGIKKICKNCASGEDLPLVNTNIGHSPRVPTVYERLRRLSGIDNSKKPVIKTPNKEEKEMKKLVEENFNKNYKDNVYVKDALIENFHWIVMRARRLKHVSQEQLAQAINEPEVVVKALEEGKIKDIKVIEKVENYLGITLRKNPAKRVQEYGTPTPVAPSLNQQIDFKSTKNLTISQLQEMKKKREAEELAKKQRKIDDEMNEEMREK
ncbi:helix-turn-helix domain-containing protein [Candidatus Pacearchaeota archaeon]|nr:helix-turn-helix domain-containing protein [Candidatus Pacearchaeota archaeon]